MNSVARRPETGVEPGGVADNLREFFERAADDGARRTCYSVTLYTLRDPLRTEPSRCVDLAELFSDAHHPKHRGYYARAAEFFPRLAPSGDDLTPSALVQALGSRKLRGIEIESATAATLIYGKRRAIGLLALSWRVETLDCDPFVALRRALDEDRRKLDPWFPGPLGDDFHHVLLLAEDQVEELEQMAPTDRAASDDGAFRELLQRYVSAATRPNRTPYLTALFPKEPNRYRGSAAAVTPGASLLGGQESHIRASMVLAAAQALANLSALQAINSKAHAELGKLPPEGGGGKTLADLERAARELRDLELDLGFNVEAQLSIRLRVPILPVEQYYSCLLEALGVERSVTMTAAMLSRLANVLEARQAAANAQTAKLERVFGTGLSVAGGLAIPLTIALAFLGANAAEVKASDSLFDAQYLGYYLGFGVAPVMLGALIGLLVWRASGRSRDTPIAPSRSDEQSGRLSSRASRTWR
jgi:hypothetical protein